MTIHDEFSHLEISRQRKYQLRRQRDGKCIKCGADAEVNSLCLEHAVKNLVQRRQKKGVKTPYRSKLIRALRESAQHRKPGKNKIANLIQRIHDSEKTGPTLPE